MVTCWLEIPSGRGGYYTTIDSPGGIPHIWFRACVHENSLSLSNYNRVPIRVSLLLLGFSICRVLSSPGILFTGNPYKSSFPAIGRVGLERFC